jgi:hypothetical protein
MSLLKVKGVSGEARSSLKALKKEETLSDQGSK